MKMFEKDLQYKEQLREKQMNKCQEKYYIKKLVQGLIVFNVYGLITYVWLNEFFRFMPILQSDSCFLLIIRDKSLTPFQVNMNIYVFLVFNWFELIFLYRTWIDLKRQYKLHNRMNIRIEMLTAVLSWCVMTICFLIFTCIRNNNDNHKYGGSYYDYLPFICIICRDLGCFYAQTLFTVFQLRTNIEDEQYHTNYNLLSNLSVMDLEVVMTHKKTFKYFNDYVESRVQSHVVYLNLYKSIQIYKKKIDQLLRQADQFKAINKSDVLDYKNH